MDTDKSTNQDVLRPEPSTKSLKKILIKNVFSQNSFNSIPLISNKIYFFNLIN